MPTSAATQTARWCSLLLVAVGGLALLRWVTGVEAIAGLIPGFVDIQFIAPLMLFVSGLCCVYMSTLPVPPASRRQRLLVGTGIALLLFFPVTMLIEHVAGVKLGVDISRTLPRPNPSPFPGRMSVNACVGFGLAALVMWQFFLPLTAARRRAIGLAIGLIGGIGIAGCIGHAMRLEYLYSVARANQLALPTAYSLVALALALAALLSSWTRPEADKLQGHARRIAYRSLAVLASVLLVAFVGGFSLFQESFEKSQGNDLLLTATTNADAIAHALETAAWFPRTVASRPTVTQTMQRLRDTPNDATARTLLQDVANSFLTAGLGHVRLLDERGNVLASAGQARLAASDDGLQAGNDAGRERLVWKDGHYLAAMHPVAIGGQHLGMVITEQRLDLLDKLVSKVRMSNATADLLLCERRDAVAHCLPSRFYAKSFQIPMFDKNGLPTLPINRALLGQVGVANVNDLRGVSVLAAYTDLPSGKLALVVKGDVQTLYAPLREQLNRLLLLLAALLALGTWALHQQVRPLVGELAQEQQRTQAILQHSNDAFVALDVNGHVTDWNAQAVLLFGWSAREAIGQPLAELIIPEDLRKAHNRGLERFRHSGTGPVINRRVEVPAVDKDGRSFTVELSVAAYHSSAGYFSHAFMRDITERLQATQRLNESEKRLRSITDNLPVLITYIDEHERLTFANKTYQKWMGADVDKALGRPLRDVLGDTLYRQRQDKVHAALAGQRVEFEAVSHAMGVQRHLHTTFIPDTRDDGSVAGLYGLSTDVTSTKLIEARLQELTRVDTLTGLPNRRAFDELLELAMARSRRSRRPMALIFLDVDHFKQINDSHGHGIGDAVLKEFATRLQTGIRTTDCASRLAGDEFTVILEGLNDAAESSTVADKLRTAIQQPMLLPGCALRVTSSMGVAFFDGVGSTGAQALMERADRALYRAKAAGRNDFATTIV